MRAIMPLIATALAFGFSAAAAHSGSALLTVSSKEERASMTKCVSFEETQGVHLFKGTKKAVKTDAPAIKTTRITKIEINITPKHEWRSIRRLRTHGFYSGDPYPSRPFTQGFYSGN